MVAMKVFAITFICLALWTNSAAAVSWVVGDQTTGYTGMFIGQYNDWLVGNPRTVSYMSGSINPDTQLGQICSHPWNEWYIIGHSPPGHFDFNCRNSVDDISANAGNVGYYVGGLNLNGVTVAQCYVTEQEGELCDSDTVVNSGGRDCIKYVKCE